MTRIEAFSDAVFAFAITLLIVSLEVPKSFHELMECMKFFLPFTACFVILFTIWYGQNLFFRRFGLHDRATVILNAALMLVVLFFVYPLKFLFGAMFSGDFQHRPWLPQFCRDRVCADLACGCMGGRRALERRATCKGRSLHR